MCDVVRTGRFKHEGSGIVYAAREGKRAIEVCDRCWIDHCEGVINLQTIKVRRSSVL